jgi:hypothetical protein
MKALLIVLVLALSPLAAHSQTTSPPQPAPCATPQHRQFDFWVGDWDVTPTGKNQIVARSLIENLYGGCAIRENWMPLKGAAGGSLNSYVGGPDGWRQTWVGGGGERVDFKGGWDGKAMVLTGGWTGILKPGVSTVTRMTYTSAADGSVRQLGETSSDDGKTWTPNFDFTYRRRT